MIPGIDGSNIQRVFKLLVAFLNLIILAPANHGFENGLLA
jgi:hypothetical protein